jgi:CHASE2 domain-containing sensor protein
VSSHSAQIANHILLVGDVARKEDAFDSPVGTGSVPGVILHASEVYTLLTKPLFTIRETWRVLADFTLAELLLLVVLLARIASPPTLNHERLAVLVTWILILGVLVFGVNVDRHRVLWDDFLVVALALFLHQYAHRWSEKLTHWLHSPEMQAKESGD